MTKFEAILRIKAIQNGKESSSFKNFPRELKGNVALFCEDSKDISFNYGFEYGEIHGLMKAFDIKVKDLT